MSDSALTETWTPRSNPNESRGAKTPLPPPSHPEEIGSTPLVREQQRPVTQHTRIQSPKLSPLVSSLPPALLLPTKPLLLHVHLPLPAPCPVNSVYCCFSVCGIYSSSVVLLKTTTKLCLYSCINAPSNHLIETWGIKQLQTRRYQSCNHGSTSVLSLAEKRLCI